MFDLVNLIVSENVEFTLSDDNLGTIETILVEAGGTLTVASGSTISVTPYSHQKRALSTVINGDFSPANSAIFSGGSIDNSNGGSFNATTSASSTASTTTYFDGTIDISGDLSVSGTIRSYSGLDPVSALTIGSR